MNEIRKSGVFKKHCSTLLSHFRYCKGSNLGQKGSEFFYKGYYITSFIYALMWGGGGMWGGLQAKACVWKSETTLWNWVSPSTFTYMGSGGGIEFMLPAFCDKCFYPMNHLINPSKSFLTHYAVLMEICVFGWINSLSIIYGTLTGLPGGQNHPRKSINTLFVPHCLDTWKNTTK